MNLVQLRWELWMFYQTFIKGLKECENCRYNGGVMCSHVDENGNCLGWKRRSFNPINRWRYNYQIKKLIKKI